MGRDTPGGEEAEKLSRSRGRTRSSSLEQLQGRGEAGRALEEKLRGGLGSPCQGAGCTHPEWGAGGWFPDSSQVYISEIPSGSSQQGGVCWGSLKGRTRGLRGHRRLQGGGGGVWRRRTDRPATCRGNSMVSSDSQTQRTALSWPRWRRGGEGMTRESGISGCKRLYIRCINNKSLQDSTGNYMEYAVISHHGKEYGKESMCITESLCCAEINTTLYIKYTSIKWMKKMKPETTMISWDWPWA